MRLNPRPYLSGVDPMEGDVVPLSPKQLQLTMLNRFLPTPMVDAMRMPVRGMKDLSAHLRNLLQGQSIEDLPGPSTEDLPGRTLEELPGHSVGDISLPDTEGIE